MKKIILALALIGVLGSATNLKAEANNVKETKSVTEVAKKYKKAKNKGKVKIKKRKGSAGTIHKSRRFTSRGGVQNGKRSSVHGGKYMSQRARTQI